MADELEHEAGRSGMFEGERGDIEIGNGERRSIGGKAGGYIAGGEGRGDRYLEA